MEVGLVTFIERCAIAALAELHKSREPVLITDNGKPLAYLVDADDYELMQSRLAVLEEIVRAERALADGEGLSHEAAKDKMSKWLQGDRRE